MSNKRIKALKELSKAELVGKARELEQALFQARIKRETGQLEEQSTVWKARKDLARVRFLQSQEVKRHGSG